MNENSYSLGIDIGGTNTVFGLVSNNGLVFKKKSIKTESDKGPIHLFDNLFKHVEAWNSESDETYVLKNIGVGCLLYTSPSPRDKRQSRMPSSA